MPRLTYFIFVFVSDILAGFTVLLFSTSVSSGQADTEQIFIPCTSSEYIYISSQACPASVSDPSRPLLSRHHQVVSWSRSARWRVGGGGHGGWRSGENRSVNALSSGVMILRSCRLVMIELEMLVSCER